MDAIRFLITEGLDSYLVMFIDHNTLTIGALFAIAGVIVKYTKSTVDDKFYGDLKNALSFMRKNKDI